MTENNLRIKVLRISRPPKICLDKLIKVGPWLLSLANAVMSPKSYLPLIMLYYLKYTIEELNKLSMQVITIFQLVGMEQFVIAIIPDHVPAVGRIF